MANEKAILTSGKHKDAYAGQTVVFPVIGEATFEADGTLTVDRDKVDALVAATNESFGFYEKGAAKPSENQVKNEEYENLKASLDALDTKELLELAVESGIDKIALASMTDGKVRDVLLKKMTAEKKEEKKEEE